MDLQRRAGNRAVVDLVQRLDERTVRGAPAPPGPTPRLTRFRAEVVKGIRIALRASPPSGEWDETAAARLRKLQSDMQLPETGIVDDATLPHLVTAMGVRGDPQVRRACILLLMDWHGMPLPANVTIQYDDKVTANAWLDPPLSLQERLRQTAPPETTISFGPSAFDQSTAGLAHTIRHELKHAEQRAAGVPKAAAGDGTMLGHREELEGELTEILGESLGMESAARFAEDANEAIGHWELLDVANRRDLRSAFQAARKVVLRRLGGDVDHVSLVERWRNG